LINLRMSSAGIYKLDSCRIQSSLYLYIFDDVHTKHTVAFIMDTGSETS
jgi:hypothetical protein